MTESVLFDFDGVIVESFQAVLKINQAKNRDLTAEIYRRHFDGSIGLEMAATKSASDLDRLFAAYQASLPAMPIVPGIKEVILNLSANYRLAIISSTHSRIIRSFLSAHHLSEAFEMVLGYDVNPGKAAKIKDFLIAESIGPKQTIFITDTLGDVYEVRTAKVQAIAVTWGFHSRHDLEQGKPYEIVTAPEDLPPAIARYFSSVSV